MMTNLNLDSLELYSKIFFRNRIKEVKEMLGLPNKTECNIKSFQQN